MTENDIARLVVDRAFHIHIRLGPGLLESVYETVLAYELEQLDMEVARQVPIPVVYGDLQFEEGFRADLIVNESVIVELKSVEAIERVHKKQLTTYLKLSHKRLGLLVNFGGELIKNNIVRIVNGLNE